MPDNGIHVIWKSCYKQLSLSYQSSGRGGGSPLGAWRCPPRRRSSAPRRMCAPRRCAGVGWLPPPLPSRLPRVVLLGGRCAVGSRLRALRRALHSGYVVDRHSILRCSDGQTTTYGAAQQRNHFLRRHVRRRKYFSGCKCGICAPAAHKLCARQTAIPLSKRNTF